MKPPRAALRITADPSAVSMARAIRTAAGAAPLFVLTGRALSDLARELGGMDAALRQMDAALRQMVDVAESIGRPVGMVIPTGDDNSQTAFIAPRAWSEERLAGWIAGYHGELEAAFGEVARVGTDAGAPGGTG